MKRKSHPKEVFLSHASDDRVFADKIIKVLRKHGVSIWYSRTHLRGANQWQEEIGRALERCDWFAVILSPRSVKSMWVKRELSAAFGEKRYNDRIVPILYRKCNFKQLHWTLATLQMVNMTAEFEMGCKELLKTWSLKYKP